MVNLKYRLNDIADDLAFVEQVMANDKNAVSFFLGVYSKPLMEYIGRNVLKLVPLPVYNPTDEKVPELKKFDEVSYGIGCYGAYYEFVAAQFLENGRLPQWDKLGYYVASPKSRFYTYLSVITVRHFLKHHPEKDTKTGEDESCSYDDNERMYLLLCMRLHDNAGDVTFTEAMFRELDLARSMLKPKDARIIELTCFSSLSTMEIANEMKDEFESDPSAMRKKDVQTRISQWKNRAILRLSGIIIADKNKRLFPCLLEYAKNKRL